jgi:hypothetical protein
MHTYLVIEPVGIVQQEDISKSQQDIVVAQNLFITHVVDSDGNLWSKWFASRRFGKYLLVSRDVSCQSRHFRH